MKLRKEKNKMYSPYGLPYIAHEWKHQNVLKKILKKRTEE